MAKNYHRSVVILSEPAAARVHLFEGVTQHQILRFRIHCGALVGARDPRPADFHGAVRDLYVRKARAPYDSLGLFITRYERHHRARVL